VNFESQRDKELAAHGFVEHPRQSTPTRATPQMSRPSFFKSEQYWTDLGPDQELL